MVKKTVQLDKDYAGPEMFTVEKLKEVFLTVPSFIMPKIRDWVTENNNEKVFKKGEAITIPSDKIDYLEIAGNELNENTEEEIREYQYDAWTLTKDGNLRRGSTGFFKDENGLYILKDGRRASHDHLNLINGFGLIIGNHDVHKGLDDILKRESNPLPAEDSFSTERLLNEINRSNLMSDVAYQAFQINVCYTKHNHHISQSDNRNVVTVDNNTAFFRIGTDETGIPIVVTRIGNVNADNILVIAGPHGDERNAQRLILWSQIQFSITAPPPDILYYFVPCISPTAAFADIRGFPRNLIVSSLVKGYDASITSIQYGGLFQEISSEGNKNRSKKEGDISAIINTNRDCIDKLLISTSYFMSFLLGLNANKNIAGIFVHGYDRSGRVYSNWENKDSEAHALYLEDAEKICVELFDHTMQGKELFHSHIRHTSKHRKDYINDNYGEYVGPGGSPFKSFDIELMEALNEGKPEGNNFTEYKSNYDIRINQRMANSFGREVGNTYDKNETSSVTTENIRNKYLQLIFRFWEVL